MVRRPHSPVTVLETAGGPAAWPARPDIVPLELPPVSAPELLGRALSIFGAFGRHLAGVPLRHLKAGWRADPTEVLGPPLRGAVEDLGVTFVKLGQMLASSPSIAGQVLSDEMRGLLDRGPAVGLNAIRRIVEEDTGGEFSAIFADFEPTPHAAASLAVVHRAVLADGTPVAVKVLRPEAPRRVAADLKIVGRLFDVLASQFPVGMTASLPGAVEGLAEQLAEELDLHNEARSMAWFRHLIEIVGASGVIVPRTFPHASGRRVLTMEFVDGRPVDDLESVSQLGIDARRSVEDLLRAWFAVTLCTGAFHGDMHAGNLLFTADGHVALLDWGILGRLDPASRRFLRRAIEGAMGEESAWDDVRAHIMPTMGSDVSRLTGMSEDQVFSLIRMQIEAIMTEPFERLNLLALVPTSAQARELAGTQTGEAPTSRRDRISAALAERRRVRAVGGPGAADVDRGELLLVKQLVFFERYGKMFLADRPLIWDADVFRALLALPQHDDTHEPT